MFVIFMNKLLFIKSIDLLVYEQLLGLFLYTVLTRT